MEILAQKKRGLPWVYIMFLIFGVITMVSAVLNFLSYLSIIDRQETESIIISIMLFAVGIGFIVSGCIYILRVKRTPDNITLNGNQVDFGNGLIVNLSQLTSVDYRIEDRSGWGTFTVYLKDQKVTYYYYDDVQRARDRIMQLVWQSKNGN